ncbi:hypothetical protein FVE85_3607 [Porphyridium purpureum]|uniref:Uncharacterized protein n=1 Tax=Porphyridium purpureum TaxID=35688 RepID=A0A5J4YL11_PORPP|nr:hypothetical protein FVE85_3607 [Porphyridium purpureum]|eukprot:POR0873..scf249_10
MLGWWRSAAQSGCRERMGVQIGRRAGADGVRRSIHTSAVALRRGASFGCGYGRGNYPRGGNPSPAVKRVTQWTSYERDEDAYDGPLPLHELPVSNVIVEPDPEGPFFAIQSGRDAYRGVVLSESEYKALTLNVEDSHGKAFPRMKDAIRFALRHDEKKYQYHGRFLAFRHGLYGARGYLFLDRAYTNILPRIQSPDIEMYRFDNTTQALLFCEQAGTPDTDWHTLASAIRWMAKYPSLRAPHLMWKYLMRHGKRRERIPSGPLADGSFPERPQEDDASDETPQNNSANESVHKPAAVNPWDVEIDTSLDDLVECVARNQMSLKELSYKTAKQVHALLQKREPTFKLRRESLTREAEYAREADRERLDLWEEERLARVNEKLERKRRMEAWRKLASEGRLPRKLNPYRPAPRRRVVRKLANERSSKESSTIRVDDAIARNTLNLVLSMRSTLSSLRESTEGEIWYSGSPGDLLRVNTVMQTGNILFLVRKAISLGSRSWDPNVSAHPVSLEIFGSPGVSRIFAAAKKRKGLDGLFGDLLFRPAHERVSLTVMPLGKLTTARKRLPRPPQCASCEMVLRGCVKSKWVRMDGDHVI